MGIDADKGEVLLRTKSGCYIGVRVPDKRMLVFGNMSNYDPDSNSVALSSYVELNTDTYEVGSVVREPITLTAEVGDILLGRTLMHAVGGDGKTNELLDALGHEFSEMKYREHVKILNEEKRKYELEMKKQDKERGRTGWNTAKENLGDIGFGLVKGAGYYVHGYFPWLYNKTAKKFGEYTKEVKDDWSAFKNQFTTAALNFLVGTVYSITYADSFGGFDYVSSHDPNIFVPFFSWVIPGSIIIGKMGMNTVSFAFEKYDERKEKIEKRRRLERVRQAVCPADSERFYEI